MSAKEILVGGPTSPLISVGLGPEPQDGEPQRYTVRCAACGPHVQQTGEGGYLTPEQAGIEAQNHRLSHLTGLVDEIKAADANVRLSHEHD